MTPSAAGVDLPERQGDRCRALGQQEEPGDKEADKDSQLHQEVEEGFCGVRLQLLWA